MKKTLLFVTLALATLGAKAQSNTEDEGVVINGVKWATRNVDAPGTFATTPDSPGMFYQWDRNVGWSVTNPLINSNGSTIWNSSSSISNSWEKANDPCPTGWRVPTEAELSSLFDDTGMVLRLWGTSGNGIAGKVFTTAFFEPIDYLTNAIFLPAAGNRNGGNGEIEKVNIQGSYWSSTKSDLDDTFLAARYMAFDAVQSEAMCNGFRSFAKSIRCVAVSTSNLPEDITAEKTATAFYNTMGIKLNKAPESGVYIVVYDNGSVEKKVK